MAQLEQTVDEAIEYDPAEQDPVTAVRPIVAQYEPAVHAVHAVAPVETIKLPARQFEQLDEDAEFAYVPDKHLEQTLAEATEYDPAAQAPVTAVRPAVAQYEPAGHAKHDPYEPAR